MGGAAKSLGTIGNDLATTVTNPIGGSQQLGSDLASGAHTGFSNFTNAVSGAGNRLNAATKTTNPTQAPVANPVTQQQIGQSVTGTGNSLQSQQNLLAALQAQNGTGIQSSAANSQQALVNALQNNGGLQAQQAALSGLGGVANQQAATAAQLQGIANGTGPNPAMAQLNQTTGQNVANQAALMAGQRGAASNVGLLARQAAQQGAATQQQAVGQGATMEAQQQLNALSGLTAQQQAQATTQNQIGALGQSLVGQQQNAITGLANQGNTLTGQQISQTNANNAAQQAQENALLGAQANYNQSQVSNQASVNSANAATNAAKVTGQASVLGGGLGALGALGAAAIAAAHGGLIKSPKKMADGGSAINQQASAPQNIPIINPTTAEQQQVLGEMPQTVNGPQSSYGQFLVNRSANQTNSFAMGGQATDLKQGGHVAAKNEKEKAKVQGDSLKNDTVPAMLSEGEIVIPRSITMGKDPMRQSAEFVRKEIAKRGNR